MFKKGDVVKMKGDLSNDLFEITLLHCDEYVYIKPLKKDSRLSNNLLVTILTIEMCYDYYRVLKLKKIIKNVQKG